MPGKIRLRHRRCFVFKRSIILKNLFNSAVEVCLKTKTIWYSHSYLLVDVQGLVVSFGGISEGLSSQALDSPELLSHVSDLDLQDSDLVGRVVLLLQGLPGHLVCIAGYLVGLLSDAGNLAGVLHLSAKR